MTDTGVVRITQTQVYQEVLSVKERLGEIAGLLEKTVALQDKQNESYETRLENHGTRLGDIQTQVTQNRAEADTKIAELRTDVDLLKATSTTQQATQAQAAARKAPWWSVVGAVTAIIGGAGSLITLLVVADKIAATLN